MKVISDFQTVGELKKLLSAFPDDAEVYCTGMLGAFYYDTDDNLLSFDDRQWMEDHIAELEANDMEYLLIGDVHVTIEDIKNIIKAKTQNTIYISEPKVEQINENNYQYTQVVDTVVLSWNSSAPGSIFINSPETAHFERNHRQNFTSDSPDLDYSFEIRDFDGDEYFHLWCEITNPFDQKEFQQYEGYNKITPEQCYIHRNTLKAMQIFYKNLINYTNKNENQNYDRTQSM